MRTTRDARTRSWFSTPLVIESIDDPPWNARLSSRAFVNATLGSNTNASCPAALHSPNVTALKLSVMPSMLATDTDCGSFRLRRVRDDQRIGRHNRVQRTHRGGHSLRAGPPDRDGDTPTERGRNADDSHHPRQPPLGSRSNRWVNPSTAVLISRARQ